MMPAMVVFAGGGLGAVLRYMAVHMAFAAGLGGAWAIMLVNVAGSFAMGICLALAERGAFGLGSTQMQLLLMTGVLGGFTTFSAFSADTLKMLQSGHAAQAVMYVGGSVVLSLLAVAGGYYLTIGKAL